MSSFSCTHNPSQNEPPKPDPCSDASPAANPPKVSAAKVNTAKVRNRIRALMEHTTRYAFKGESRLAADSGVSKSALNRLLNGHSSPSFVLVSLLTGALEQQLSKGGELRRLDPRDLVSLDGTYPTPSVCALASCRGCLPTSAYDENEHLKPEYRDIKPGQWSLLQPVPLPQPEHPQALSPRPTQQPQPESQSSSQPQKLPPLLVPVEIFADGQGLEDVSASEEEAEAATQKKP